MNVLIFDVNSINPTNAIPAINPPTLFFNPACQYQEIDYINHPVMVAGMLEAGMPAGSRIVAKFPGENTRYVLSALTQELLSSLLDQSATLYIEVDDFRRD